MAVTLLCSDRLLFPESDCQRMVDLSITGVCEVLLRLVRFAVRGNALARTNRATTAGKRRRSQ